MNPPRPQLFRIRSLWLLGCLAAGLNFLTAGSQPRGMDGADTAEQLLARLRAISPDRALTNQAVLEIRPPRPQPPRRIPLRISVFPTLQGWCALYELHPADQNSPLRLWIERSETQPPRFFLASGSATGHWPERRELTDPAQRMQGLAGSDFAPADLGMEFLFWPEQRLLRSEMRRGQFCDVLESTRPDPSVGGYSRVRAWFDRDTGGLVYAEGLDHRGRVVKEFLPRRFRKIDGRWEVAELEMIHRQSGSRTRLLLLEHGSSPGR